LSTRSALHAVGSSAISGEIEPPRPPSSASPTLCEFVVTSDQPQITANASCLSWLIWTAIR
jgi:hypothetical protein